MSAQSLSQQEYMQLDSNFSLSQNMYSVMILQIQTAILSEIIIRLRAEIIILLVSDLPSVTLAVPSKANP